MLLVLNSAANASGKLGGIVARSGRAGAQLLPHRTNTQPRTPSQQNSRALIGSVAAAWRQLTAAQQANWSAAASLAQSGYTLFAATHRKLLTFEIASILQTPVQPPTFPPIASLTLTPTYTGVTPPVALVGWQLTPSPALTGNYAAIVRMTQPLSPAKGYIDSSDLRIVETYAVAPADPIVTAAVWQAVWGQGASTGQVTATLELVDLTSGYAAPAVSASSRYAVTPNYTPPGSTVLYDVNGIPIAVITGQTFEQEGTPIAAP